MKEHRIASALCACVAVCVVGAVDAREARAEVDVDAVLSEAGLGPGEECIAFESKEKMHERAARWRAAIDSIADQDSGVVLDWITGASEPPEHAREEARAQLRCMIGGIVAHAATEGSDVRLDYGDGESRSAANMRAWAKKVARSKRWRTRVTDHFTRSHYRTANGQAGIWHRKYTFKKPRSFNKISAVAAEACRLTEGNSWRPTNDRHRRCWLKTLSPEQRQIEILGASSAPGLSRHHWGTDYDVFGLNPRSFVDGAKLHDEYVWMTEHAWEHGFFQTYFGPTEGNPHTYMEERWHWSYYPVAHALLGWATENQDALELALNALWDRYEKRWNGSRKDRPFFSHLREHWRGYVLTIGPHAGHDHE